MCTIVDTPFLQISAETELIHSTSFHPELSPTLPLGQNNGLCSAIKLNACNWTYSTCSQVYVTWIAIETQIIHFNMPSRCNSWGCCWSCTWCDSCGGLCWNNNNNMEVQAINLLLCNYSLNLGPSTLLYLHHTD